MYVAGVRASFALAKLTAVTVTRYIVGYKTEESDNLLKFLYDHIAVGADFQVRIKWQKGTVVVWDVSKNPSS